MRLAALLALVACRGSSPAPASGSGSAPPRDAAICAPAAAMVRLVVTDESPRACWTDCKPPPAWIHAAEVRMDRGVLSICTDGCRPIGTAIAEIVAGAKDPARIAATTDGNLVVVEDRVYRVTGDRAEDLRPPIGIFGVDSTEKPDRVVAAGPLLVVTFDDHGQLYNSNAVALGDELLLYEPNLIVELDDQSFFVTDKNEPRFSVFDMFGRRIAEVDTFVGFTIEDAVRLHDGVAAILLRDDAGLWIVTYSKERKIIALEQVPLC